MEFADLSHVPVTVPVVDVGIMHVGVNERGVLVPMPVWDRIGNNRIMGAMRMSMVRVMYVRMIVGRRLVRVFVHMTLRYVKPDAHTH